MFFFLQTIKERQISGKMHLPTIKRSSKQFTFTKRQVVKAQSVHGGVPKFEVFLKEQQTHRMCAQRSIECYKEGKEDFI